MLLTRSLQFESNNILWYNAANPARSASDNCFRFRSWSASSKHQVKPSTMLLSICTGIYLWRPDQFLALRRIFFILRPLIVWSIGVRSVRIVCPTDGTEVQTEGECFSSNNLSFPSDATKCQARQERHILLINQQSISTTTFWKSPEKLLLHSAEPHLNLSLKQVGTS